MNKLSLIVLIIVLTMSITLAQSSDNITSTKEDHDNFNVLVRTDNKSVSEVEAELIAAGVPSTVIENAISQLTTSRPNTVFGVSRVNALASSISTDPMGCLYGVTGLANFAVDAGDFISEFTSNTGPFTKNGYCLPFPVGSDCGYMHLGGGGDSTVILKHEAEGFNIGYEFPGFATCAIDIPF